MADLAESVARRFEVLRPHLTEFQRRLWLGTEAAELGSDGVAVVAHAVGVASDTVRRGRAEADGGVELSAGRSRKPGGGRKRAESHDPGLAAAFESLIEPVTLGDPMSPLRWTSKSIRKLTAELRAAGHLVSDSVVRRLLAEQGYSLQANVKTADGGSTRIGISSSPTSTSRLGVVVGADEFLFLRVHTDDRVPCRHMRPAGNGTRSVSR